MVASDSDAAWALRRYFGLSEAKAAETMRNKQLTAGLMRVAALVDEHGAVASDGTVAKSTGALLYQLASRLKPQCAAYVPLIVRHVCAGGIGSEPQLAAAMQYALAHCHTDGEAADSDEFRATCGIGACVSPEDVEAAVADALALCHDELLHRRYAFNVGKLMGLVKRHPAMKWADGAAVRREIDLQVMQLLGPKTEEELCGKAAKATQGGDAGGKVHKARKAPDAKAADVKADRREGDARADDSASSMDELLRNKVHLHTPGDNHTTDGYVATANTGALLQAHLKRTGGKVRTRFPPEPNGILHIGHAKAININFGYARAYGGQCYLRYDDTNPEKEEHRYFQAISDTVRWLGYSPERITYSSDNFDRLYALAVELIRRRLAYVCHQRAHQLKGFDAAESPWRDRPVEESLRLFDDMRRGKVEEGGATLRMRHVMEEGKKDPVAYRIKFVPHARAGDKWCIYPTYDFTHCLCDSFEDMTHSLCTKEFQSRRSSYYWLCNALDLYCPVQWEYSRLSVAYTVVSKRKIQKLIDAGVVSDWDDPRLFTLTALRRRGCPPEAVNNFVAQMGLTVAQSSVEPAMLDACVRDALNATAPRCMAVMHPLRVVIANWPADKPGSIAVSVADFPGRDGSPTHTVPFAATVYIERDDFRESAEKGYKRLTATQPVGLKHVGKVLSVVDVIRDAAGSPTELRVEMHELTAGNKPRAFVHWLCEPGGSVQLRLYERLFEHANPEAADGGFVNDCRPNSLTVIAGALVDAFGAAGRAGDRFQFERIGYFAVDPDSASGRLIFNRTVMLKEDAAKS